MTVGSIATPMVNYFSIPQFPMKDDNYRKCEREKGARQDYIKQTILSGERVRTAEDKKQFTSLLRKLGFCVPSEADLWQWYKKARWDLQKDGLLEGTRGYMTNNRKEYY